MDVRMFGFGNPNLSTLCHLMDLPEKIKKSLNELTRTYVRVAKAMAATPTEVKEYPNSYIFVIDMPGLNSGDIKVQVLEPLILQ